MEQKREEIEQLEQELAIVTSGSSGGKQTTPEESEDSKESLLVRQLRRRVRKLRKEKLALLERVGEMEQEAGSKDEDLERHRRRAISLMTNGKNGHVSLKQLLEENAVLSRMIRIRDDKINFLIDQLNRHQLIGFR